jgi:hypothetical protein
MKTYFKDSSKEKRFVNTALYRKSESGLLIIICRKLTLCSLSKVNSNFETMLLKYAKGFSILALFTL